MSKHTEWLKTLKKRLAKLLSKENKELKHQLLIAARFLGVFIASFILVNIAISFVPIEIFEYAVALLSAKMLELLGYSTSIVLGEPVKILLNNMHEIEISYLCTGLLESTVIVSALIASLGISIKKRVIGIIAGLAFVNVLNIFRIVITANAIAGMQDVAIVDFIHNLLFKVVLFVGVACYYALWFLLASRNNQQ
ncbi:MAG: exosortase/archaeosortase family protein [Candidatus Diapherotrites archaeon]|nr:exosortase/archaeosortase family protein [Candidatus Diapherotrites archaeon]